MSIGVVLLLLGGEDRPKGVKRRPQEVIKDFGSKPLGELNRLRDGVPYAKLVPWGWERYDVDRYNEIPIH